MNKQNKIAYWFLLLTVMLLTCGIVCVGTTHAHYQNNIYWNTVVQAGEPVISDCLVAGGQTVLLGDVKQTTAVTIRFESDSKAYGILNYYLMDSSQEEYISAFLSDDIVYLSDGTSYVNLFLMPTENAALLEEDLDVDIFVSFSAGDQFLHATFRATLPGAVVEEKTEGSEGDDTTGGDDIYSTEDDTEIIPGIGTGGGSDDTTDDDDTTDGDDIYSTEEDTEIIPGIGTGGDSDDTTGDDDTAGGDDIYSTEDDTEITPGIGSGDGSDDTTGDDDTAGGDDVYSTEDDTEITPGIGTGEGSDDSTGGNDTAGGDDIYSVEDDTEIIPGIGTGEGSDDSTGDDDTTGRDDVYSVGADIKIISGIVATSDDDTTGGDDVYSTEDDTEIIPGIGTGEGSDDSTGGDDTAGGDDIYSVEDDTEIIPGIGTGEGSDDTTGDDDAAGGDDVYSTEDDTEIIPGIGTGEGSDDSTGGDDTTGGDDIYSAEDDTEIIPDIGTGEGSDDSTGDDDTAGGDDIYSTEDDTGITPDIGTGDDYDDITTEGEPENPDGEKTPDTGEPTIPVEPELPITEDLVLNTLTAYSKTDYLPVFVSFPDGITHLEVCLLDVETGMDAALPAYTRYSADGGNSWYMLYFGGTATIDGNDLWDLDAVGKCLLFDFSAAAVDTSQALCIQAVAYTETDRHLGYTETYSMDAYSALYYGMGEEEIPVLTADRSLTLSERGADGYRQHTLEHLVQQADGAAEYEYVSDNAISVRFGNGTVELSVGDVLPAAGTYRLSIEYYFNGICFAQSSHTFFVNYSGTT